MHRHLHSRMKNVLLSFGSLQTGSFPCPSTCVPTLPPSPPQGKRVLLGVCADEGRGGGGVVVRKADQWESRCSGADS